jgi:hypothetical protein
LSKDRIDTCWRISEIFSRKHANDLKKAMPLIRRFVGSDAQNYVFDIHFSLLAISTEPILISTGSPARVENSAALDATA